MHVRRPSAVRWDHSNEAHPFILESRAMPGRRLRVWRTDGYTGPIPRADWMLLVCTRWPEGRTLHVRNHHGEGFTRYDVFVLPERSSSAD